MSSAIGKAVLGAAEIAGALALTPFVGPAALPLIYGLIATGIATEAGAIAQAIGSNQGMGVTTRQPAAYRQIIYGVQRVGGTLVYVSTTGSTHRQYNMVIALATHQCEAIENIYLDGRQVFWNTSSDYNKTVNGYNFGGNADSSNHTGPNGAQYNFGGKVFCAAFYGDQTSDPTVVSGVWVGPSSKAGFCSALEANDPTWTPNTDGVPYLAGCTYVYLKVEADSGTFPQLPEVRFTVHGKNDIWDPRSSTRGFSNNWALVVGDVLSDTTWGLGEQVNQAQLMAAASVCDESVACAAGFERRYSLDYHFDTSRSPGDVLQEMMSAAAGRLSRVGGEYFVWPAYWQGPSFSFDAGALVDTIQWTPRRALAELFNRVTGTYIAPNYPYNVAGNLYDSNGYFMGGTPNNFPFSFQPTNFPQYASDPLHGYGEDVYLVEDTPNQGAYSSGSSYTAGAVVIYNGFPWRALESVPTAAPPGTLDGGGHPYWAETGNFLPREISLTGVLSVSQAQRVAKIYMMRNRQQGSGTLTMNLSAFQMAPVDVLTLTIPQLGWTDKVLEIAAPAGDWAMKLSMGNAPGSSSSGEEGAAPAILVQVRVQETDSSVYLWDPAEELTPYDVPAITGGVNQFSVEPITGLNAISDLSTALVQPDGTVTPRVKLTWDAVTDTYVTNGGTILVQMCAHSSAAWQTQTVLDGQATQVYLRDIVAGLSYDVRVAVRRSGGAQSTWTELDGVAIGVVLTSPGANAVAPPGTLTAYTISSISSYIHVANFTASFAGFTASCAPSPATLNVTVPGQRWYVYYIDATFAGGAIVPIATQDPADFVGKPGYYLIGSIIPPAWTQTYAPSNFNDLGSFSTTNPGFADDGLPGGAATVGSYWQTWNNTGIPGSPPPDINAEGSGIWNGFPALTFGSSKTLHVTASASASTGGTAWAGTVIASIGGTSTTLVTFTATNAGATYSLTVPASTDLSTISVQVTSTITSGAAPGTPGDYADGSAQVDVFEIWID